MKNIINEVAKDKVSNTKAKAKKEWMTSDILTKMEQIQLMMSKSLTQYRKLNKEISSAIKTTKGKWLDEKSNGTEGLDQNTIHSTYIKKSRNLPSSIGSYFKIHKKIL